MRKARFIFILHKLYPLCISNNNRYKGIVFNIYLSISFNNVYITSKDLLV